MFTDLEKDEYFSKCMTPAQFADLVKLAQLDYSCSKGVSRWIKYITPTFDMRTGLCHAVSMQEYCGEDTIIRTTNEFKDLKESLYERCVAFVTGA